MKIGLNLTPSRQVFAAFALYAFSMGNIFPRLAEVQAAMGKAEGAFGLGLIGAPVGTLLALTFATPLLEWIGHRRVLLAGTPLLTVLYAIAVHAPSPLTLFFLLVPIGAAIGCIEIIVNLEADRTEHQIGYRIMNRSHAFWSIGFFSAGLFGATLAWLGVSPGWQLGLVVPCVIAGLWLCLRDFQPAPPRISSHTAAAPRLALPTAAIMILVAVTLSAMLLEGASMDWSAIYMRDVFAAGPFLAGITVAAFAICQAATRFFADGFVDRFSPTGVAQVLLSVLFIGCVLVSFSPSPALSLLGFALMGAGTSAIFPLAMSAAAQLQDRAAVVNIAALAQTSFMAFLLGPPLLGFVAQYFGIRTSFGIAMPLIVLGLWATGALRRTSVAAA